MQTTFRYRFILWFLCLLSVAACHRDAMPSKQAVRLFFAPDGPDSITYDLRQLFDPYDGGKLSIPEPTHFLILKRNGSYYEREGTVATPTASGYWAVSPDGKSLALTQGAKPTTPPKFDHTLMLRTSDSLILGRQGRHGVVEFRYKCVAK